MRKVERQAKDNADQQSDVASILSRRVAVGMSDSDEGDGVSEDDCEWWD